MNELKAEQAKEISRFSKAERVDILHMAKELSINGRGSIQEEVENVIAAMDSLTTPSSDQATSTAEEFISAYTVEQRAEAFDQALRLASWGAKLPESPDNKLDMDASIIIATLSAGEGFGYGFEITKIEADEFIISYIKDNVVIKDKLSTADLVGLGISNKTVSKMNESEVLKARLVAG